MKNPLFTRKRLLEYSIYGAIAAALYMVPVTVFLYNHSYENLYYLYLGCGLFMAGIFFYCYRLLYRPYSGKRAVSMLLSGLLTTVAGIGIAAIAIFIGMWIAFPDLFGRAPSEEIIAGAPATNKAGNPGQLLLMILTTATIGNFAVGAFISVITSYAGKIDQRKDKPAQLETNIPHNPQGKAEKKSEIV